MSVGVGPLADAFAWLGSNTVGILYRAGTGNVDPWTKQQLIADEAGALVTASGGSLSQTDAETQASADITNALMAANSDPSSPVKLGWVSDAAAKLGIDDPASALKTILEVALIGLGLLVLLKGIQFVRELRR